MNPICCEALNNWFSRNSDRKLTQRYSIQGAITQLIKRIGTALIFPVWQEDRKTADLFFQKSKGLIPRPPLYPPKGTPPTRVRWSIQLDWGAYSQQWRLDGITTILCIFPCFGLKLMYLANKKSYFHSVFLFRLPLSSSLEWYVLSVMILLFS